MKEKFSSIALLSALFLSIFASAYSFADDRPLARYRYSLRNIVTDNPELEGRLKSYVRSFFDGRGLREGSTIPFDAELKEEALFIDIELVRQNEKQSSFSIGFYNNNNERLYYRYERIDKIDYSKNSAFNFLGKELENFIRIFSREGIVTGIDDKRVSVIFNKDLKGEGLVGKTFELFCIDDTCREVNEYDIKGVVTEVKDKEVLGHFTQYPNNLKLYDLPINGLRVHIQDQKNYEKVLGEEEVLITERNLDFNPQFLNSFRACAVLPFTGSFEALERSRNLFRDRMANDARCIVKDDEKFYRIFDRYKGNLALYLRNRDVIKATAEKLKAGSIFRVNVDRALGGLRVSMDVVSENGSDVFFKERKVIDDGDYKTVVEVLYQWMIKYVREFPYDAKVIDSVEGDILFDLGVRAIHTNNQLYEVYRPTKLRIISSGYGHKVEWERKLVARGIVDRVQNKESVGRLLETDIENLQVRRGDWVKLVGADAFKKIKPVFAKHNLKTNRRTGRLKVGGDILLLNGTQGSQDRSERFFSIALGVDYYLPYGFIFSLDSERNSQDIFSFDLDRNTVRGAIGYAKLIEGNLFVSLVDLFVGYTNNFVELSALEFALLGDITLTGPYVGAKAEVPLYEKSNLHFGVYAAPFMSVENTVNVLGPSSNGSYYAGYVDIDYTLDKNWSLFGEIRFERNSFEIEAENVNIGVNTTRFRIGAYWNF